MNRTYSAKPADVTRSWHLIDASGLTLGRLSTRAARLLSGKDKVGYTPHIDGGDFVVIINAASVKVAGNKAAGKLYYRHSGYPGGIRAESLADKLQKDPAKVIEMSIRGMLAVNKLRTGRLARLKIYAGAEHPHSGQLAKRTALQREEKE